MPRRHPASLLIFLCRDRFPGVMEQGGKHQLQAFLGRETAPVGDFRGGVTDQGGMHKHVSFRMPDRILRGAGHVCQRRKMI